MGVDEGLVGRIPPEGVQHEGSAPVKRELVREEMRARTQLVGDVVEPARQRQSRSPEDGNRDCGIAAEVLSRFDVKLIFTNSASASGSPATSGDRQRGIVARQPERLRRASHIHARLPHARRRGPYSSSEISAADTSLR